MWLLSTDRAELHYFANSFDATGGYAILSHTWDKNGEQNLQEVRAIAKPCRRNDTNPRDFVHPKIRECCIIAEKHGYHWVWIDSCCIDKTSSSELSEAINSMFRWYREAEVCYAYLADVPDSCILDAHDSLFRMSRWHTRGWTLQELIAPDFLIFLSTDWRELGNRTDLAQTLKKITQIPLKVLTGEHRPANYSVSFRMSWASMRKTTKVEDEAYCLMGRFGVSFPTNYGEGNKAFIRLQYEIMKHNPDMTLFAFGCRVDQHHRFTFHPGPDVNSPWKYLMADSPRDLDYGFGYIPAPRTGLKTKQRYPPPIGFRSPSPFRGEVELPRATVTSYGVELRLPIYEANGITIAVTLCEADEHHFGLFLTRDHRGKDPTRPLNVTGLRYAKPSADLSTEFRIARMVDLGTDLYNLTLNGTRVKTTWRTIYVVPTVSELDCGSTNTPQLRMNCNPKSNFRVPRWLIARFNYLQCGVIETSSEPGYQSFKILLKGAVRIFVSFGSCIHRHDDPNKPPQLWAKVYVSPYHHRKEDCTHNCCEDHLDSESWATRSKVFGDADRAVRLSLMLSTRMPERMLVIHLELLGRLLQKALKEAGLPSLFPPIAELEGNTPFSACNDTVASFSSHKPSQMEPTSSRAPSQNSFRSFPSNSTSTTLSRSSRIPRPVSQSPRNARIQT